MGELENSGYRGEALQLLKQADCNVGDILKVSSKGHVYEGILIPRFGDGGAIIIKMKSGYNIGIRPTADIKIEKIGKGSKPTFAAPPLPKQNTSLPHVVIMSTGGTIASRVDYRTGAVRSALSASDLYGVVPELSELAQVDTEIVFSLYSENITPQHWTELTQVIAKRIEQGVEGLVIAHGTDTMAYTSAALSFSLQNLPVPVILVGAQRSSDRPSSDAATDLIGAVKFAGEAPFAGVGLAMHETVSDNSIVVHRGTKVRKCHTSRRDTFKSINGFPLANVKNNIVTMIADDYLQRDPNRKLLVKPNFSDKVALVKFHPGLNPSVIDFYVENGMKGILLEGSGLGHVSKNCFEAIKNAIEKGVVVALASQCIWGRVNMNVYDTGRDLLSFGVIPLKDMFPETGLVKLMWVLGQTSELDAATKLLKTNIAGEYSPRTLMQEEKLQFEGGQ
ncbi:MAG: Glu-tRNA(Gln) amidotransferase subunit GatD [Candidatus Bathyarchaeota archaeon]|nr:Glu-tRNA(Gln) amidotransferase subunit GatD [Candidatus Bathyarchaeota archaeon]NLD66079.1 Glu-tRNA(Gln) amidotransferase subunit GatD [Thermoproteota archaeon]